VDGTLLLRAWKREREVLDKGGGRERERGTEEKRRGEDGTDRQSREVTCFGIVSKLIALTPMDLQPLTPPSPRILSV